MNHDDYDDKYIIEVLRDAKTVAMVGASANWNRPSFFAMKYMQQKGFRVIPVNPGVAGKEILGEMTVARLDEIEDPSIWWISFAIPKRQGKSLTMPSRQVQKSSGCSLAFNDEAAKRAEDAGLRVVMNRCPKIEYARLYGELSWHGINSHVITSKRRKQA